MSGLGFKSFESCFFLNFKNILATALKSYIKWLLIFFLKKFEKVEKIGCHSSFDFECNTERGFKESLSIALGLNW